jgi:hypothetical protein
MNESKSDISEWLVSYMREVTPFSSFRSALSYANGLANSELVKRIDPVKRTIDLIRSDSQGQGSMEFEIPRSPYEY